MVHPTLNVGQTWTGEVDRDSVYISLYGGGHVSHFDMDDKRSSGLWDESDYRKEVIQAMWSNTTDAELIQRHDLVCGYEGFVVPRRCIKKGAYYSDGVVR